MKKHKEERTKQSHEVSFDKLRSDIPWQSRSSTGKMEDTVVKKRGGKNNVRRRSREKLKMKNK